MEKENLKNLTARVKGTVKFSSDCKFVENDDYKITRQAHSAMHETRKNSRKKIMFRKLVKTNPSSDHQQQQVRTQTERIFKSTLKKQDRQTRRALEDIQSRGITFFNLGFNSCDKKPRQKKLFCDFYNLSINSLKSTMNVGQLWSNKDKTNFFKQNKVHMNKVKLMQKISTFKKQNDKFDKMSKRLSEEKHFLTSSSIGNSSIFSSIKTIKSVNNELNGSSKYTLMKDFQKFRKNIAEFHHQNKNDKLDKVVKEMQICNENIEKMEQKYFETMLEM